MSLEVTNERATALLKQVKLNLARSYDNLFENKLGFQIFITEMIGAKKVLELQKNASASATAAASTDDMTG